MNTYILEGNVYSKKALATKIGCSEMGIYLADKKARERGENTFIVKKTLVEIGENVSKKNFYSSTNNENMQDKFKQLEDALSKAKNLKNELIEIINKKCEIYRKIIDGFYAYKEIVNKEGESDDVDLRNKEIIIMYLNNMIKFDTNSLALATENISNYNFSFDENKANELVKIFYKNLSEFSEEDINNKIKSI